MKDNVSPEEKLLRLIKGEKKPKSQPHLSTQSIAIDQKTTQETADLKPPLKNPIYSLARIYLTSVNIEKLMVVLIVISFIYLIASFIYPWTGLKKINLPGVSSEKIEEPKLESKEEPSPYESYLQGIRNRQIFGSPVVSSQQAAAPTGAADADLIKDINLVGIISSDPPQAVIEDKRAQKTYYVSKGQFIGAFQVEDIQEGKIILNYKGQRYELYL